MRGDAKQWVLWAVLIAGVLTVVSEWTEDGRVSAVIPAAVWVLAVLLTLFAEFAPRVAVGLAVLILASSALITGPNVWKSLQDRLAGKTHVEDSPTLSPNQEARLQQPKELRDGTPPGTAFA